jgi:hypothetical protein
VRAIHGGSRHIPSQFAKSVTWQRCRPDRYRKNRRVFDNRADTDTAHKETAGIKKIESALTMIGMNRW